MCNSVTECYFWEDYLSSNDKLVTLSALHLAEEEMFAFLIVLRMRGGTKKNMEEDWKRKREDRGVKGQQSRVVGNTWMGRKVEGKM